MADELYENVRKRLTAAFLVILSEDGALRDCALGDAQRAAQSAANAALAAIRFGDSR